MEGFSTDETDQTEVFAWLAQPASHGGVPVIRIDSSAAVVFLAGALAIKVKRAVNLGYLDFRTLAARERACAAELRLNRVFAPELYLAQQAIWREDGGGLMLGPLPDGAEAVDHAVIMHRFADDDLGSKALAAGRLTAGLLGAFAAELAARHNALEPGADEPDEAERLAHCLEAAELLAPQIRAERLDAIAALLREGFGATALLARNRAVAGQVKRGHGDLHLDNLCLFEGRLLAFDALEFDEQIATGDVLYDLAFLEMDLLRHGRPDLALTVHDRYLEAAPQAVAGALLMPYFIALRALIRAFANHAAWRHGGRPAGKPAPLALIEGYLRLIERVLPAPGPRLIAVGGLSGSGKSALARGLAPHLGPAPGALVLRSDVIRKRLAGVAEETRLPAEAYGQQQNMIVYDRMFGEAAHALAAGRSVILDAVFARPEERERAEAAAGPLPFAGLWLEADPRVLKERVERRRNDASDATGAVVQRQSRRDLGTVTWLRLAADGAADFTLLQARRALGLD